MTTVPNRLNDLTVDATQTALDSLYLIQHQNGQLIQSWFGTLEANRQSTREIMERGIRQSQEVQRLWFQLGQQWVRTSTESTMQTVQQGLTEVSNGLNKAQAQTSNGTKKAEAAAK